MARQIIAISDFQQRHPHKQYYATDREYTALACKLYELLHESQKFMEEQQIRNACITLALFFEDIHSGTRQFETFTHLHQKMFGRPLPFFDPLPADNAGGAEADAINFMFWYSCTAERNGRILNPLNRNIRKVSQKIWDFWLQERNSIHPNEELADYLFSEETQSDAFEVKNVLVWLQSRSMFGRWFSNPSVDNDPYGIVEAAGDKAPRDFLEYSISSYSAFDQRAYPLSLKAQTIYAEMIRLEMDDEHDEMAAEIAQIEAEEFGFYNIVKTTKSIVTIRDFKGDTYDISIENFMPGTARAAKGKKHFLGALFRFQGKWHSNGLSVFETFTGVDDWMESEGKAYALKQGQRTQYDGFIKAHGGNRMFFFKNVGDYKKFMRSELGIVHGVENLPIDLPKGKILMMFLEPCGQATLSAEGASVKHPANKFYNKAEAEEMDLGLICHTDYCSPDALLYMMEHDLLPDAMLNDMRGREYGKRLMQQNMEFLARCMRRDIPTDTPCAGRQKYNEKTDETQPSNSADNEAELAARYATKVSYDKFVESISEERSIRSSAGKEWRVVSADHTITIVLDPRSHKEFYIPTRDLYEAHLALSAKDIQIASVTPFVGKQNASAAAALLYNIVGRGRMMNMLRKMVRQWV